MKVTSGLLLGIFIVFPAFAQQASYLMTGPQLPRSKQGNGHVQTVESVDGGRIRVTVATSYGAIGAHGPYSSAASTKRAAVPDDFDLPGDLAMSLVNAESVWTAATRVLTWVSRQIVHDEDDVAPQDAVSVIHRRKGRCSGLSNAAAALLMAAGFEARTVSGLLMTEEGAVPHRWVECQLPGAGWVQSDPTLGLWVVTPRHIAFDEAVGRVPAIEVLEAPKTDLTALPHVAGLVLRPNEGGELVCRLIKSDHHDGKVTAKIHGPAGERRSGVLDPVLRFSGLLPGVWQLVVEREGRIVEKHRIKIVVGVTHSLAVKALADTGVNS
jgi:hypothetical protein